MKILDYDAFVKRSDQSEGRPDDERLRIAIYGLASEVGSVVSAVKKRILAEDGQENWNCPNDEIVEELGDVIWYCFALARLNNPSRRFNIFSSDIENLKRELEAGDSRAQEISRVLDVSKREQFLTAAQEFPNRTHIMEFDDYQDLAFLTARTSEKTLVEVCLAVLSQLSAELFRRTLPDVELDLNRTLPDRDTNVVLGEIAWHVSALASAFGLRLGLIAQKNMEKVSYRLDRDEPTPLHDDGFPPGEQLPRYFEVDFVPDGQGRSVMVIDGEQIGDPLTDNYYEDDGYRFHDVMHLANAAKLGWSPVLRSLMKRKRRSKREIDEIEDGARARIVEEAVVKIIHSEGVRIERLKSAGSTEPVRLFPDPKDITFRFLKMIHGFVDGLEVGRNRYWEWEEAITSGHYLFHRLREEGKGTVIVDLEQRTVAFEMYPAERYKLPKPKSWSTKLFGRTRA